MYKSRIAALALVLILLAGLPALAAPTYDEVVPELTYPLEKTGTLSIWIPLDGTAANYISSYAENESFIAAQAETGVALTFVHPTSGTESEQFNLMAVSGDMPDIVVNGAQYYTGGAVSAVDDGVFVDITDKLPEFSPAYYNLLVNNEEFYREMSTDGRVFTYVNYKETPWNVEGSWNRYQIRKDWLAQALPGAETLWTLADWETYLQWIVDNQPDVIAPFGLTGSGYDQLMAPAFGFLTGWYQVEGKVKNGYWQEGLADYLALYHSWYEKGYISKDFTTLNNQRLFESGLAGSYNGASNSALARCMDLGIDVQNTPYPRQYDGQWINGFYMLWPNNSMTANISTTCKDVDLAMAFMDYGYTMRGSQTYNYGMEGKSWVAEVNDDYTAPQYTDYMLHNEKYTIDEVNNILRMHQVFPRYRVGARFSLPYNIKSPEILAYHLQWVDDPNYGVDYSLPPLTLSTQANARRSEIWSNVQTYASEMILKFIVGTEPLENFDQYMATIQGMGVEEAIALTQEAYDAHMAK